MDTQDVFRDLCEASHDLIQSVSPEGRFLYVNRAWLTTLGYTSDEVARLGVFEVIHPDSREHCRKVLERLTEGEPAEEIETAFVAKDGRRVDVQGRISCRFEEGRPVATRAIFQDITAGKATQEELDRLFRVSPDLLCIAGTDGYFKRINPAFVRVLGYSRKELLSRQLVEFVHPDDRERTLEEVKHLADGGNTVEFFNRYRAKDGSYRWLSWRSTAMPSTGKIYATARDITEQRRNREILERRTAELARSNADLEQFASVASHDLQAPLRSLISLSEWIEDDLEHGRLDKAREQLALLQSRAKRMESLTSDLLEYSRAGNIDEKLAVVDTDELVRQTAALCSPPEGFDVKTVPPMPTIQARRTALEQVLRNLIGNAIAHHDRADGTIEVGVEDKGRVWEFSVTDDGPGIPKDKADEVFEMFHRLKSNTEGTGMGLALVKKHVERRGGRAWVEPSEGRGATLRFTWPKRGETDD